MNFIISAVLFCYCSFSIASTNSWTLIHEEDGIRVFKETSSINGVIPFKAIGIIDSSLHKVTRTLQNYKKKPSWSPKLKHVTLHKKLSQNEYIFSEYYSTPWPATDREFLLQGKVEKVSKKLTIFSAHSINSGHEDSNHIQANVKYIDLKLTQLSPNKTKVEFSFHGDMKGWMPIWLMNIIQKKWPMRFIQGLRTQV